VVIASGAQVVSLATAASNFPLADFGPEVSHASSSSGVPLNAASACFAWHLTTAATSFPTALAIPSSHLPASFDAGMQPVNDQALGADRKTPIKTHKHHRIVPPRASAALSPGSEISRARRPSQPRCLSGQRGTTRRQLVGGEHDAGIAPDLSNDTRE